MIVLRNMLSARLLSEIPSGKSNSAKTKRRELIIRELDCLKNKSVRNPSFPISIKITSRSIGEIAHHASGSYESTIAALHLKHVLKNATVLYVDLPKNNNQEDNFSAWITIILHCEIECVGEVKMTVVDSLERGWRGHLGLIAYCLTKAKE